MRLKYTLFLFLIPMLLNAQDTLTLSVCLEETVAYSPRLRDKELIMNYIHDSFIHGTNFKCGENVIIE